MPTFTKNAIKASFMKLLKTKSFDSITVKDIVDDCGINRNTFYYNFKDIYDLTDEIMQSEIDRIVAQHKPYHSWNGGFLCAAEFAVQNKKAILNIYNSSKYRQLERYFKKIIYDVVIEFVEKEAQGMDISDSDKQFAAGFYTCALLGLLGEWLDRGMEDDFTDIIRKAGCLFENNIQNTLDALSRQ